MNKFFNSIHRHRYDIFCSFVLILLAIFLVTVLPKEETKSLINYMENKTFDIRQRIISKDKEARKDIVTELDKLNIVPTSMIDISDGLSSELIHIGKNSHCGCRIYEDRIPIDYQTAIMAEELNMNLVTAALNGGEDYELLL